MLRPSRIGIDTGGTFTDFFAVYPDGSTSTLKLPSTPNDPVKAIAEGIARLTAESGAPAAPGSPLAPIEIIHASTVALNAVLTRTGGPTAFITTKGFKDLLILGRQARPRLYALHPRVPEPLCPDDLCLEVDERLAADGRVLRPLAADDLARLRERVHHLGVASVAVVLLHSYLNDAHEREVASALSGLGLPISLSCDVLPAVREYERAQATLIDAYVAPVMRGYLQRLEAALEAQRPLTLRVMHSTGGAIAAGEAVRLPVRTLLSGPAAGVIGAHAMALRIGLPRVMTLDMGGTSTDVSVIDGEPVLESELAVAGLPLELPMLSVHTIGAGGGSYLHVDAGGALLLGPSSAGILPGPACLGRGGTRPTLTDASLLCGRLFSGRFCGGAVPLFPGLAEAAMRPIAERLGIGVSEASAAAIATAGALVARAVRSISVERGHDPRDFALLCFGGAGGLIAAEVAEELEMQRVLVPPSPGLLSAYGALCAPVIRERMRTLLCPAAEAERRGDIRAVLSELIAAVKLDLVKEGAQPEEARIEWHAELRYLGQSYELALKGSGGEGPVGGRDGDLARRFVLLHQHRYGFTLADTPVELVRLRVRGSLAPSDPPRLGGAGAYGGEAHLGEISMTLLRGGSCRAAVLFRGALPPGWERPGPALIVEYSATTVVPPAWRARVDAHGALHLSLIENFSTLS